jgi:pentatricopeptide repeat protein
MTEGIRSFFRGPFAQRAMNLPLCCGLNRLRQRSYLYLCGGHYNHRNSLLRMRRSCVRLATVHRMLHTQLAIYNFPYQLASSSRTFCRPRKFRFLSQRSHANQVSASRSETESMRDQTRMLLKAIQQERKELSVVARAPTPQTDCDPHAPWWWYELEDVLTWWTAQNTQESIYYSFQLLQCLDAEVQEKVVFYHQSRPSFSDPDSCSFKLNGNESPPRTIILRPDLLELLPTHLQAFLSSYQYANGNDNIHPGSLQSHTHTYEGVVTHFVRNWLFFIKNSADSMAFSPQEPKASHSRYHSRSSSVPAARDTSPSGSSISLETVEEVLSALDRHCMPVSGRALSFLLHALSLTTPDPYQEAVTAEALLNRMISLASPPFLPRMYPLDKETALDSSEEIDPDQRGTSRSIIIPLTSFSPSLSNWNMVMSAWAKSNVDHAPRRIESLIERLFNMDECEDSAMFEETIPDSVSYGCLVSAYARTGQLDASLSVLERLCSHYFEDSQRFPSAVVTPPTLALFNTVLHACASAKNNVKAPEHAQSILRRMYDRQDWGSIPGIYPDRITLNTVLLCWAKSKPHGDGAKRAHDILRQMEELGASDPEVRPDLVSYTTVLDSYAKRGDVENATELFNTMYQRSMSGEPHLRPNLASLTTLIDAWGRSDRPDRVVHAEAAFERIQELHRCGFSPAGPDIVAYNS